MAKDAKGHGSEKQGGVELTAGGYVRARPRAQWTVTPRRELPGASPLSGAVAAKAQGVLARMNAEQHGPVSIAASHGIQTAHLGPQGGPIKVQALDTKRAGQPWATKKAYGNRTVAETVAKGMRTDGGYMRIKAR